MAVKDTSLHQELWLIIGAIDLPLESHVRRMATSGFPLLVIDNRSK